MSKEHSSNPLLQSMIKNAFDCRTPVLKHLIDDEDLLLRWTDHQLSEEEHTELLNHLAQCSTCRCAVAEMTRNGILEFREYPVKQLQPSVVRSKNTFRYTASFLGILMTSALCLLFCMFFLQGTPDQTDVARNGGSEQIGPVSGVKEPIDLNAKLEGATRSISDPMGEPDKFALLVGINKYGKLKESEWLDGCHNDIEAVKTVITDRFGFDASTITILLDDQATAAGIREQMKKLTELIRSRPQGVKPIQVLFYFSGHGSRVPDIAGEDGFGSSLVVYDSEQQGSSMDISSAELNKFSHEICSNGKAELLMVLDSCHSGGGARGITKFRGLTRSNERPAVMDLNAPKAPSRELPEGLVFLSACQSNQKEPEHKVDGKTYGLLTYYLTMQLQSEQIVSSLDYAMLKDIIYRSYQRDKIAQAPTPTVEGSVSNLRKPILGADHSIDRKPYWEVKREGRKRDIVRMEAGKINGITEHSLFELYKTAEQALDPTAKSLGWFRITKVDGNFSLGEIFRWKDENRLEKISVVLPNDFTVSDIGYAVERYHDYGDNVLAVRVVNTATGKTVEPNDPTIPEAIRSVLLGSGTSNESPWIFWKGENETCDIVIKFDADAKLATVFPATGSADDDSEPSKTRGDIAIPDALRGGWGPIAWGPSSGQGDLQEYLRKIMVGISLKRLVADKSPSVKVRGENTKPELETKVFRPLDDNGFEEVESQTKYGIVLPSGDGEWYQLQIKNNGDKPFYITVVAIDPDMQIDHLSCGPPDNPKRFNARVGTDNNPDANRLEGGELFVSNVKFVEPLGMQTLIVLATREESNFSSFVQSGLGRFRGTPKGASSNTSRILQFINEQCGLGKRGAVDVGLPRDDEWAVGSVDVFAQPEKE